MKNHGMVCPPPKIKKRTKTLRDPTIITFTHFLRTLGVFRRQMCPVTSGRVDNCVRLGQRPYACLTIRGCLSHARTHTRSNATVVTGFCSSFPLAEFPFPLLKKKKGYFVTISGSGVRCAANARHCRQLCILFP